MLRQTRMRLGMSQDALGAEVHISGSQIGNYEAGRAIPPDDVLSGLVAVLKAGSELQELAERARGEAVAPWLRSWAENERRAAILRSCYANLIPGLLQTETYARSVIAAGPHTEVQVEEMTRERMARQAATLGREDPVLLHALIGEAALRIGDPVIMKEQLEHLVGVGFLPNVIVRVVPFSAGPHPGLTGAFDIATLLDGATVAYRDSVDAGEVVTGLAAVRYVQRAWELVSARALPGDLSRDLMMRVVDEHEHRIELAKEHPERH
ncbi:helix-turn-helix domain-containing protein [Micromonospora sp. NBC_01813]|uniref:helix-turn-helix domain-containing protein n=1 Tax=Micromonospora sp. NBC_01813 TaxID=2975988 RepID=UPI002DDA687D|nr:helix-turn-helix transcriptional regulator [Micromonospora sp. NBC_01813]WSA07783.1 helix-turn-helix transcriptional regulator [Micromonospora sp. NBC_01813]